MSIFENLKSYMTFLSRNRVYALINVFGLSVSLMFVLLIGIYTQQEYSVDSGHSKADRILALGMEYDNDRFIGSHWRVQPALQKTFPEIEATCATRVQDGCLVTLLNGEQVVKPVLFADSTFFRLFDYELIAGDRAHALDSKDGVVIEEQFAKLYFGDADPMGKTVTFDKSLPLKVTGVVRRMDNASLRKFDLIVRYEHVGRINPSLTAEGMNNATGCDVYILLKENVDAARFAKEKAADMDAKFKEFFWYFQMPGFTPHTRLVPFKGLYFSEYRSSNGHAGRGDRKLVNILFAVGLVILLFSMMNYTNLTTAQSGYRSKEMAVRRLVGSQRIDIIWRLIGESVALCVVSLGVGIGLAYFAAPYAGSLLNTELRLETLLQPADLLLLAGFTAVVGVVAGVVPAVVISRAKPIDVVRGTFRLRTKMVFSKVFITFQNLITIVLLGVALTMILQTRHLINAPLGFERENIINLGNPSGDSLLVTTFVEELKRLPCVTLVSKCMGTPSDGGNNQTMEVNRRTVSTQQLIGDEHYMEMFGLEVEKEYPGVRGFYFTRRYLEEMGLRDTARSVRYPWNEVIPVRGILKEFHLRKITDPDKAIYVFVNDRYFVPWTYAIKVQGNPVEAWRQVQETYKRVFHLDCDDERPFIDQEIAARFEQEQRTSTILSLFAGIAILISLLGLVAMSTYFIRQREKEIAVRKVFGSTGRQIWVRLVRTFLTYVGVAFVLAVPIIYYFMSDWLSNYAYRISLSWWIYAAAGAFCLVVSFAAVFIQSYLASNENPINHIKDNG